LFQNLTARIENIDLYKLALQLTLLDFILKPVGSWEISAPVLTVAILALLIPGLLKNIIIWFLLAGLTLTWLILDWPLSDNHAYLLFIWCFAIFLSTYIKDKSIIGKNARMMIGCVFLFAVIWKALLSPDFLDGRFFSLNMVEDPRFSEFTQLTCDITKDELNNFRDYVKQHVDGNLLHKKNINFDLKCLNKVSYFLTYYSVSLEFIIALLFLLPKRLYISKFRDYFLILFCVSIYSVATVEGFGWLLIAMGISQCDDKKYTSLLYILCFLIILIYREVPVFEIIIKSMN